MNILQEIIEHKRLEVAYAQKKIQLAHLEKMPHYKRESISLKSALQENEISVIAEIKKASPSKGIISVNFNPVEIARDYVAGGAAAISILTDKKYFQGNIKYISDVRAIVPTPILRKDFIIDPYQLYETKAFGADAVLLIVAALEPAQLQDLHSEAEAIGLECLVEIHDERELRTLDLSKVKILGINNRNLTDFSVDILTTIKLAPKIPSGLTIVSESGISNRADIEKLIANGIHAVLIGESLMHSNDIQKSLRALTNIKQT